MSDCFLAHDGKSIGPYSIEQLRSLLGEGRIKLDAMAWREGMAAWAGLSVACPELGNPAAVAATGAPPPPRPEPSAAEPGAAIRARSFSVQNFANRVADLAGVERLEG